MAFEFGMGAIDANFHTRMAAAGFSSGHGPTASSSTPSLPVMPAAKGGSTSFGGGFGAAATRSHESQRMKEVEQALAESNKKLERKNASLKALSEKNSASKVELESLKEELRLSNDRLAKLREQMASFSEAANASAASTAATVKRLRQEKESAQAAQQEAQRQAQQERQQVSSLADQLAKLKEGTASQDAHDLRAIQQLTSQVQELQGTLRQAQATAAAAKKDALEADKRADESRLALGAADAHSDALVDKLNAAAAAAADANQRAADAARRTDDTSKEVSRLRSEADGMRSEIARLKREVESQRKAADSENAKDDAEIASLQAELKAVNSRLAVSLSKTAAITADLAEVRTALGAAESRVAEFEAAEAAASVAAAGASNPSVAAAEAKAQAAEASRVSMAAELAAARTALHAEQQSVQAAQTAVRIAKESLVATQAAQAKTQAAVDDLRAQLATAAAETTGKADALKAVQAELVAARRELAAAQKVAGEDDTADAKLKTAYAALQASKAESDARSDALAVQLAEAQATSTALRTAVTTAEAARDKAKAEVRTANTKAHTADLARDQVHAALTEAKNALQVATTEKANYVDKVKALQAELVAARRELAAAQKAAGEDDAADAKLKTAYAALQASKAESDARSDALAVQLAEMQGQLIALRAEAASLRAERASLEDRMQNEQQALAVAHSELSVVQGQLSAAQGAATSAAAALAASNAAREEHASAAASLRAQLAAAQDAARADSTSDVQVQGQLARAQAARRAAEERTGQLTSQVAELQKQVAHVTGEFEMAKAAALKAEGALVAATSAVAASKEQVAAATAAARTAKAGAQSNLAVAETHAAALKDSQALVQKLRAELSAAQLAALADDAADAKLTAAYTALQSSKAESNKRSDALTDQLAKAQARVVELQAAWDSAKERLLAANATIVCEPGDEVEARWPDGTWLRGTVQAVKPAEDDSTPVQVTVQRHVDYGMDSCACKVTVGGPAIRWPCRLLPPAPPARQGELQPTVEANTVPLESSVPGAIGEPSFSEGSLVEVCLSGTKWSKAVVQSVQSVPSQASGQGVWMYTVDVPTSAHGDNEIHVVLAERVRAEQAVRRRRQKAAAQQAKAVADAEFVPLPTPLPLAHWVFFDVSFLEQWVQEQIDAVAATAADTSDVDTVALRRAVLDGEYSLADWDGPAPSAVRVHLKKEGKLRNVHTRNPHEDVYSAGDQLPLLWLACMVGGTNAIAWLTAPEQGCNIEERVQECTPLIWAASSQRVHRRHGVVRALVAAGADCSAVETEGGGSDLTPLLGAVYRKDVGTVRVLAASARAAARSKGHTVALSSTASLLAAPAEDSNGRTAAEYAVLQWTYFAAEAGRLGLQPWTEMPSVPSDESTVHTALLTRAGEARARGAVVDEATIVKIGQRQKRLEKKRDAWRTMCDALVQHVACDMPCADDAKWSADTTAVLNALSADSRRRNFSERIRNAVVTLHGPHADTALDFTAPALVAGLFCAPLDGMPGHADLEICHAVAGCPSLQHLCVVGAESGDTPFSAAGKPVMVAASPNGNALDGTCTATPTSAAGGQTLRKYLQDAAVMKVVLFGNAVSLVPTAQACLAEGFAVTLVEDAVLCSAPASDKALLELEAFVECGMSELTSEQLLARASSSVPPTRAAVAAEVLATALSSSHGLHSEILQTEQAQFDKVTAKTAAKRAKLVKRAAAVKAAAAKKAQRQAARQAKAEAKAAQQAARGVRTSDGASASANALRSTSTSQPPGDIDDAAVSGAGAVGTHHEAEPGSSDDSDVDGGFDSDSSDADTIQSAQDDHGDHEHPSDKDSVAETDDGVDAAEGDDTAYGCSDNEHDGVLATLPITTKGKRKAACAAADGTAGLRATLSAAKQALKWARQAVRRASRKRDSATVAAAEANASKAEHEFQIAKRALSDHRAAAAKARKAMKQQKQQLQVAAAEGGASDFAVLSAKYGARNTYSVVTGTLGRRHTVASKLLVTNVTMGGDPLRGVRKELFVWAVRGAPVQLKLPLSSVGTRLPSAASLVQGSGVGDTVAAVVVGACVLDRGARVEVQGVVPACWAGDAAPQLSEALREVSKKASNKAILALQIVAGPVLFAHAKEHETLFFAEKSSAGDTDASFTLAHHSWTAQAGIPASRAGSAVSAAAQLGTAAVLGASYGARDTFANATAAAQALAAQGKTAFKVTNQTMGGDPLRGARKAFSAWIVRGCPVHITVTSLDDLLPSASQLLSVGGVAPTAPSACLAAVITQAKRSSGDDILKDLSACVLLGDAPAPAASILPSQLRGALPVSLTLTPGRVMHVQVTEGKQGSFGTAFGGKNTAMPRPADVDWVQHTHGSLAGRIVS